MSVKVNWLAIFNGPPDFQKVYLYSMFQNNQIALRCHHYTVCTAHVECAFHYIAVVVLKFKKNKKRPLSPSHESNYL